MEQTTHRSIADADKADKAPDNTEEAQTVDANGASYERCRWSRQHTEV